MTKKAAKLIIRAVRASQRAKALYKKSDELIARAVASGAADGEQVALPAELAEDGNAVILRNQFAAGEVIWAHASVKQWKLDKPTKAERKEAAL